MHQLRSDLRARSRSGKSAILVRTLEQECSLREERRGHPPWNGGLQEGSDALGKGKGGSRRCVVPRTCAKRLDDPHQEGNLETARRSASLASEDGNMPSLAL